jgi:hypothetical protein
MAEQITPGSCGHVRSGQRWQSTTAASQCTITQNYAGSPPRTPRQFQMQTKKARGTVLSSLVYHKK